MKVELTNRTKTLSMFKAGYVSVVVYENIVNNRRYIDTVVFRKVHLKKSERDGGPNFKYVRGANLKPADLPDLITCLTEAQGFIQEYSGTVGKISR